ncbi:ABC transporter ATP-binding protein [Paracidovorax konjaci]|uniref:Phospholipid/cholesterol/gamma-HCH transport system ATP-binding protein n=1 Tax=Paracidovorax konjaci TaxID=32040 RepID=A0A1I1UGK7_9BURK|nr:ATP-binding cassette domain-containing protein [Paracidovorax konjaci]SFD69986.1 phospholipid/cholesterol/gamma-HCH transport system ATP-binding protein [Paracidovorax konjaci]
MAETGPAAAPPPPDADAPPVVEIRGLSTVFGKGDEAFAVHENLDLTVRRGEILALVGGSGTGKTVLLRQMLGLTRPAKGSVTVLGRPAAEMGRAGAASRVGMLFQHGALFSAFSVLDNVAFALREQGTLPKDLICDASMVKLRLVGLKPEHATRMPADLSGGMIKRVALARALIMDPPLLLLDEPTAGLDPNSSDEFCELLRELHAALGLTVVMVTHDLDTLFALSTRVAVLAEKRVITSGTPQEVAHFEHPFIQQFFLGERGRRAMAPAPAPSPGSAAPGQEA